MPKTKENLETCSPEKFQQRLKECIKESGMSQRRVAIRADINPYIITKAVRYAVVPSMRTIIKVADALDVSIAYLLGDSDVNKFVKAKKPTTFHKRIAQLSEEKKVKYSRISKDMPFAHNAIYEWLRTETIPSLGYMKALAKYFDVSLDYMTGRTDKKR